MRFFVNTFLSNFNFLSEFYYFARSPHSAKKKWVILRTYVFIKIKYHIFSKFIPITEEMIFGIRVSFFDYETFHFLFREIFIKNEYYFKSESKRPIILDCGANVGMAIAYFKWLYPNSIIFAFEPDKQTFLLLKKNIEQNNFTNINIFNVALAGKMGKIDFYIDKKNPGNLTMSTIKNRMHFKRVVVESCRLSQFIENKKIDFLKMDIEGSELEVFKELAKSKKLQQVSQIVMEYHHLIGGEISQFSQLLNIFEKNGYAYRVSTGILHLYEKFVFQDILLYLYKV